MASPQYSLKWTNHQRHLFAVFRTLLHTESLVDVTLVCKDAVLKAHKIILSACSPYFAKIFAETPGKHPTVVLNSMLEWELQALIDFMYRGEVSVSQEHLPELMKAADALMIQGLTTCERELTSTQESPPASPDFSSTEPSSAKMSRADETLNRDFEALNGSRASPASSESSHLRAASPTTRRKQARPKKRVEESPPKPGQSEPQPQQQEEEEEDELEPQEAAPVESNNNVEDSDDGFSLDEGDKEPRDLSMWPIEDRPLEERPMEERGQPPDQPSSYPLPPSRASSTVGHKMTGPAGVPMFSAPRGGPPRHWSNENLTEALRNVWSGRMKTAQASRVFGIPYNSLLMYVRGKYGKSLKLDLIRKGEIPSHLASEPFNVRSAFLTTTGQQGLPPPHMAPFFPPPPSVPQSERSLSMLNNLLAVPPAPFQNFCMKEPGNVEDLSFGEHK